MSVLIGYGLEIEIDGYAHHAFDTLAVFLFRIELPFPCSLDGRPIKGPVVARLLNDHIQGRLSPPPELAQLAYVDGSRVVHDDELHGAAFMKAVLESLASLDREVGAQQGWTAFQWKEADQRSARHDAAIFNKVQDVVRLQARRASPANAGELEAFLALTPAP